MSDARAEAVLRSIGADLPDVVEGRMFNGRGLRVDGGFFAFVDHLGRLVVKLPQDECAALVAAGDAEPMVMRGRALREWVALPAAGGTGEAADDEPAWRAAAGRARAFVRGG